MNQQTKPEESIVLTVSPSEFNTIKRALCIVSSVSIALVNEGEEYFILSGKLTDQKDSQLPDEKKASLVDTPSFKKHLRLVKN